MEMERNERHSKTLKIKELNAGLLSRSHKALVAFADSSMQDKVTTIIEAEPDIRVAEVPKIIEFIGEMAFLTGAVKFPLHANILNRQIQGLDNERPFGVHTLMHLVTKACYD